MNTLAGYLCQVFDSDRNHTLFFGERQDPTLENPWENFETCFTPFKSYNKAEKAKRGLRKQFDKPKIISIDLLIAETGEEAKSLKQEKNLIVIQIGEDSRKMYGPRSQHRHTTLPGCPYEETLATFQKYEDAEYLRTEMIRQTGNAALIGILKIQKI